jgi:hypothetical protein
MCGRYLRFLSSSDAESADRWGTLPTIPGGIAMSAMLMETRTVEYAAEPTVTQSHPRGRGFRVLSRIARGCADGAEVFDASAIIAYAPRHRRDIPPERTLQALAI